MTRRRNVRVLGRTLATEVERAHDRTRVRLGELAEVTIDAVEIGSCFITVRCGDRVIRIPYARTANGVSVAWGGETYEVVSAGDAADAEDTDAAFTPEITAPMPGTVLEVLIEVGREVDADTPLLVLEAMKMEQTVRAPASARVREIRVNPGERVGPGQVLAVLDPVDTAS